ncbi:MAG: tripartite tricarboxylate transporter TctB family protein [Succinivibrio sp.]|nr:tripartite tricarboxylate transporter TctB family protein [Succinivibrio sp.]
MKIHDALLGLIIFVGGLIICYVAKDFPDQNDGKPGPWLFPVVLSLLFSLSGLILFFKKFKTLKDRPLIDVQDRVGAAGMLKILVLLSLIIFYILTSEFLGFLIAMGLTMLIMMLVLRTKLYMALLVSACATLGIYLIFAKVLLVPLPEGLFYF